ncbi:MAG: peroxiredoxin [Pseudomonadota bacterium]|jgi:peroxiredoxin|nr:thiol peroxidase [Rhodovulum sp. NI22]MDY6860061.1 peroxiredoxin [Pseudomonadota bacterium]|tara:strand:+ start:1389 stop:1874 length:486 start_codon:yes stop_codon:yes gene_type:complete
MTISVGDKLPDATMVTIGENGPEPVELSAKLAGRKVVMFGLPGAYTTGCSTVHLPSFIRTVDQFRDKGVDEVICVSVNDPFVLDAWGRETGAKDAGITFLADADGSLTRALDMAFSAPQFGLYGRSGRYAVVADDGVVTLAHIDEPGVCDASTGESLLEAM